MDGQYEIDVDHIRALAIKCHAFDIAFDRLFNELAFCESTEPIYRTYNRLLSEALLNLAISIRVSLADESEYRATGIIHPAALFLEGGPKDGSGFSIKDICDKLIHADRVYKPIEPGVRSAGCELSGSHKGEKWVVGLSVQIFCEYLLQWLDQCENRHTGISAG